MNMKDIEQKEVFAKNLNRYLSLSNKSQKEVADAIGVSPQTFNTWCQAIALPRMGKVQRLADYFHIGKSNLIDKMTGEEKDGNEKYYLNDETAHAAQEIFENRELRMLFDAAHDADPEDLRALHNMALALRRKERGYDDDTGC